MAESSSSNVAPAVAAKKKLNRGANPNANYKSLFQKSKDKYDRVSNDHTDIVINVQKASAKQQKLRQEIDWLLDAIAAKSAQRARAEHDAALHARRLARQREEAAELEYHKAKQARLAAYHQADQYMPSYRDHDRDHLAHQQHHRPPPPSRQIPPYHHSDYPTPSYDYPAARSTTSVPIKERRHEDPFSEDPRSTISSRYAQDPSYDSALQASREPPSHRHHQPSYPAAAASRSDYPDSRYARSPPPPASSTASVLASSAHHRSPPPSSLSHHPRSNAFEQLPPSSSTPSSKRPRPSSPDSEPYMASTSISSIQHHTKRPRND